MLFCMRPHISGCHYGVEFDIREKWMSNQLPKRLKVVLEGVNGEVYLFLTEKDASNGTWGPLHGLLASDERVDIVNAARTLLAAFGVTEFSVSRTYYTEDRVSTSDKELRHYVWVHARVERGNVRPSRPGQEIYAVTSLEELTTMLMDASPGTAKGTREVVARAKLLRQTAAHRYAMAK